MNQTQRIHELEQEVARLTAQIAGLSSQGTPGGDNSGDAPPAALRARREDVLSDGEARYRALFESSMDGIILVDPRHNGRILAANPAACQMLGWAECDLIGKGRDAVLDLDDPALVALLRNRERDRSARAVLSYKRKDGSSLPVELSSALFTDRNGEPRGVAILRDVTERRRAEDALRAANRQLQAQSEELQIQSEELSASNEELAAANEELLTANEALRQSEDALDRSIRQFRTLIENLHSGVALVDEAGRFSLYNRRFLEMFGLSPEASILNVNSQDWSAWQVLDETGALLPVDEHPVRKAAMTGEQVRGKLVGVQLPSGGDLVWMQVSAAPLPGPDGRPEQIICTYHDVTARRRAEEDLRAADRQKDEFLAMLAHELRNPLAAISSAAHLLQMREKGGSSARAVEVVGRQAAHMAKLLDDLLDVSRITHGKITLRRERMPLTAAIESAVQAIRPRLEEAGHRLHVSVPGYPLTLEADPVRIAQVIGNLLANAVKYTPHGGDIHLAVEPGSGEVAVRVRDNGIGISAELLPQVFDIFVQADHSLARAQGGLGIGLTMVRSLVEMHGGRVEAHSEGEGRGSEFVIRLPLAQAVVPEDPRESPLPARPRRVLVVDDNADAAEILALSLEADGHEVVTATSGPAALQAAAEFGPEVVLLDLGMPVMDGYAVARSLREDPRFAETRIVALTGYGQDDDRRQTAEAGFDAHLVKPVAIDALLRVLQRE